MALWSAHALLWSSSQLVLNCIIGYNPNRKHANRFALRVFLWSYSVTYLNLRRSRMGNPFCYLRCDPAGQNDRRYPKYAASDHATKKGLPDHNAILIISHSIIISDKTKRSQIIFNDQVNNRGRSGRCINIRRILAIWSYSTIWLHNAFLMYKVCCFLQEG